MKIAKKIKNFFKVIGPGMITGVADNDPSGIATCSQTGAQFGFGQLWTIFLMLPLMIAIQEVCARIGTYKGKGLASIIQSHYGKKISYCAVTLLLIANIINIGADIGSMAAAAQLIFPLNYTLYIILFITFMSLSEIFIGYKTYARILTWLCLFCLAYPITLFVIQVPIWEVLKATLIPHIEFNFSFLFLITGIFGTTISPYMFFWQTSQEVEEDHARNLISANGSPRIKKKDIFRIRVDTIIGMVVSQIVSWSIVVVAGSVLFKNNIHEVKNAAQAAKMLEPMVHSFTNAGYIAKVIFATGIIGLGLVAVPVLAGSASYALCDLLNWRHSLNYKYKTSAAFYNIILLSMILGVLINYIGINPIKALVYSAVINGVLAVPLIFLIAMIGRNKKIMGKYKSNILSEIFVWLTFLCMLLSAVSMIFAFFYH